MGKRLLGLTVLCALLGFGCSTAAIIDEIAEPDKIYHSGIDLLSGTYNVLPNPGDQDQEKHQLSLHTSGKGWTLSQPDAKDFTVYEMPPEEMEKIFGTYNAQSIQCAETIFAKICAAPKGTKSKDGKFHFKTGYIVAPYSEAPKQLEKIK